MKSCPSAFHPDLPALWGLVKHCLSNLKSISMQKINLPKEESAILATATVLYFSALFLFSFWFTQSWLSLIINADRFYPQERDFPVGIFWGIPLLALIDFLYYICLRFYSQPTKIHLDTLVDHCYYPLDRDPYQLIDLASIKSNPSESPMYWSYGFYNTQKHKQVSRMKKNQEFHLGETTKVVLLAIGFLAFIMLISYLYWYA